MVTSVPLFSEDMLEHIFLPFVTSKEKGTGLGLVVCKRIMLMLNKKHPDPGCFFHREAAGRVMVTSVPLSTSL
jgi:K+-sensing histidine kinase KdpD